MQNMKATRVLCVLAVAAWALPRFAAWAGPAKSNEEEAWKAERKKLEDLIETKVSERVTESVSAKEVAQRMKLPWPVRPPTMSVLKIEAEVKRRVETAVDKKYPMTVVETYRKDAQKKYALHKPGDNVSFVIRGGRGTNTTVEGRLRDINELRMRIGSRWVVRTDVEEEVLARLDPAIQEKYIARYVRVETNKYKFKRRSYGDDVRKKTQTELYTKANYTLWGRGKKKKWVPIKELVDQAVAFFKKQYAAQIRMQIQKQVFVEKGYILYQGEWMPKKVAESVQDKLKKLLAEKKEKAPAKQGQMGEGSGMEQGMMGAQGEGMAGEGMGQGMGEGMDPAMMGGEGGMMGAQGGAKKKK